MMMRTAGEVLQGHMTVRGHMTVNEHMTVQGHMTVLGNMTVQETFVLSPYTEQRCAEPTRTIFLLSLKFSMNLFDFTRPSCQVSCQVS
jgi:UDP-3-O-[3-hydroxymyristoyl] glucosamine N-acyltransferase